MFLPLDIGNWEKAAVLEGRRVLEAGAKDPSDRARLLVVTSEHAGDKQFQVVIHDSERMINGMEVCELLKDLPNFEVGFEN